MVELLCRKLNALGLRWLGSQARSEAVMLEAFVDSPLSKACGAAEGCWDQCAFGSMHEPQYD